MTGCWLWHQCRPDGYAQITRKGLTPGKRLYQAHRWYYELYMGPIPDGLHLDHLCRVPRCVNPQHLEPVTPRENVRRGFAPSMVRALSTHCANGHPFDDANSYIRASGARSCRACRRATRRYRTKRQAA